MKNGNPTYSIDENLYKTLAKDIYEKSSRKVIVMGGLGLLIIIVLWILTQSGIVVFWSFVIYYISSIVSAIMIQNKQVDETGRGLQGLKCFYWKYAIERRLKIMGVVGNIIFGILFKFILPAVNMGIKDANRGRDD